MKIDRIDHLVLTVRDIAATVEFYGRVLGMEALRFGDGRTALHFGHQKINLHQAGSEFEPRSENPTPGSADICFVTQSPLADVAKHLRDCDIEIESGPVRRTGANGPMESIYIRDPDGNPIELSRY